MVRSPHIMAMSWPVIFMTSASSSILIHMVVAVIRVCIMRIGIGIAVIGVAIVFISGVPRIAPGSVEEAMMPVIVPWTCIRFAVVSMASGASACMAATVTLAACERPRCHKDDADYGQSCEFLFRYLAIHFVMFICRPIFSDHSELFAARLY